MDCYTCIRNRSKCHLLQVVLREKKIRNRLKCHWVQWTILSSKKCHLQCHLLQQMSSIITFTSCSKWNHLNRTSLFSVVAVWHWCLPKRAECLIGTSICSKKSITSARPDRARFHVVFPWSNYHNFPVKKCNENHFGLRNYNTWCQPFPNKFHGLRTVCVQWFQRKNTISPRTLGP